MNIIGGITAALALISAIIAADARYTKSDDLTKVKNEIINEMRREVSKNRSVMIARMRRDADDLEYQMMEFESKKKQAPRYIIEKHKEILRQIEELKKYDEKDKNDI
jgi:hypothetical protein